MAKNPRLPKNVLALIARQKPTPLPPIPAPPSHVIPTESLWERFRRRRNR
jgi:hypothetical protein